MLVLESPNKTNAVANTRAKVAADGKEPDKQ
jgi:hypothetical protein